MARNCRRVDRSGIEPGSQKGQGRTMLMGALPLLILFALPGCASRAPTTEVRSFAAATDAFNAASQPLLDDLAIAERHQVRVTAEAPAADPTIPGRDVLELPAPAGGEKRV